MKITKTTKTNETNNMLNENLQVLTEAEEVAGDVGVKAEGEGETIEATVEMTSTAETARPANKRSALKIKNALTIALDRALDDAKFALEEDDYGANCNVLITGLPGSSKTATIRNWCEQNGCKLFYLDAKNPDLQLLTSGAGAIDRTDPEHPKVNTAYSNALAKLDRPNSILFLDELNRQIKEYMRGSLLTLIADRRVAGEDSEGFRYFPNLLFTVAAVNPAKQSDRGASKLNEAEKRRFYYNVEFNSEVKTTKAFIDAFYNDQIMNYVEKHPDLAPADIERINSFCLRQYIGNAILSDPDFYYTTVDEYIKNDEEAQILCQSKITELINHSRGNLKRLLEDITTTSGLNEKAKKMLKGIVSNIILPNVDELRAAKSRQLGINLGVDEEKLKDVPEDTTTEIEVDDGEMIEDDPELAATISKDKAAEAKYTADDIKAKLASAFDF